MSETTENTVTTTEVPASRTIVTSENLSQFTLDKVNEKRADDEKIDVPGKENPEEKPGDKSAEKPASEAKPEKTAEEKAADKQKGLDYAAKLSKAREAAEKERQRAEAAEKAAEDLRRKYEPPSVDDAKPRRDQFANDEEYELASEDYIREKLQLEQKQSEQKRTVEKILKSYQDREAAYKAANPEFAEDLAENADTPLSFAMRDAILESEVGPQIMHHLIKNPDEHKKILGMTALGAIKAIGKLETKIEGAQSEKKADKTEEKPVEKAVSKAPPPIEPLKGNGETPVSRISANGEYKGTYKQWKEDRRAGRIH